MSSGGLKQACLYSSTTLRFFPIKPAVKFHDRGALLERGQAVDFVNRLAGILLSGGNGGTSGNRAAICLVR